MALPTEKNVVQDVYGKEEKGKWVKREDRGRGENVRKISPSGQIQDPLL